MPLSCRLLRLQPEFFFSRKVSPSFRAIRHFILAKSFIISLPVPIFSCGRQLMSQRAAAGAGADNDHIETVLRGHLLIPFRQRMVASPRSRGGRLQAG